MGKSTISMAIFNCYVSSPEGTQGMWTGSQWSFLGTDGLEVPIPYLVGGAITILKNISQWEGLSHIFWTMKHVPNHQPDI